jgi:[acyl-carrier-protein] S-malonyltransferase
MPNDLKERIEKTAFAFRGYNVTNMGRSRELLEHPAYGRIVRAVLTQASELCSDATGRRIDLVEQVRALRPSTLATFPDDVGLSVAMGQAQIELLERFFGVPVHKAKLSFGYSIGELNALVFGNVYTMDQILPVPVSLANDCAELATDVTMGILFTRAPDLNFDDVKRLCVKISSRGEGMIAPSACLSPNTVLLLGQGKTLESFREEMEGNLSPQVHLRRNPDKWPPLHTPLTWLRNIPNRTGLLVHKIKGGLQKPVPPILSCVTGEASYDEYNSRELLVRWTDHPQLLWDVIYETLAAGVELIVHVGPEPNLIPATFARLSSNVSEQMGKRFLNGLGRRVISSLARHAWVTNLISSKTALLRAPFIDHIILEDWLLAQHVR